MKIVILNDSFFNEEHLNRLRTLGELEIYNNTTTEDLAIERLNGADIALVDAFLAPINKKVLESTNTLKLIALSSTAYTIIDLDTATSRGVKVANIPGFSKESVAELTIGLMLASARKIPQGDKRVRAHPYDDLDPSSEEGRNFIGFDIKDKTFGILGLGKIGSIVAKLANSLGMKVIAYTKTQKKLSGIEEVSLEELLKNSDVISINLPLTEETKNIIGEKELSLMKPTATLINIGRAEHVDTEALYKALSQKKIRGAALDLLKGVNENHPILKLDNVIFTPHLGSFTEESFLKNMPEMIISNVEAFVKGNLVNVVN